MLAGAFLQGGDLLDREKRHLSRTDAALIAMGILLAAAIIFASFTYGGSAKARNRATKAIWEYIDENYPDVNVKNHGEKPQYLGAGSYSLMVSDSDCEDVYFYVIYTGGNITDDYYYKVEKMTNTLLRLEKEMGNYFAGLMTASGSDIKGAEVTFSPRVRNDIPDSIYIGAEFDSAHPIYRGSTLTILCKETEDIQRIAELIKKARIIAKEQKILFSEYAVYGVDSENSHILEVNGVTAELAESDTLADILERSINTEENISESDVYVRIY